MHLHRIGLFSGLFAIFVLTAQAQDRRTVTEPRVPAACTRLAAKLTSTGNNLSPEDDIQDKLDTARIQAAIDACKPGLAVELTTGGTASAFLSGPLELREGVTLVIDKGVTLYASRDPRVYEVKPAAGEPATALCGTIAAVPPSVFPAPPRVASPKGGCRALIAIDVKNAGVMGEGVIDGRGYAKLIGHDYSWWELARKAEPTNAKYYSTKLIQATHADGLILYGITLHNAPNYHVLVNGTSGFTAWGVHLQTPTPDVRAHLAPGNDARNTDGIDPGQSNDVTIAHSWIDNGDDNVAVKAGTQHMSVLDNHFYTGHGMSIGSDAIGQAYLLVDGLVEDHTSSGIRIKSNVTRGGPIHDLTYRNICMRDVANPIAISPYYTNQTTEGFVDPKYTGDKIPDYKKILLENIEAETPGDVLIAGLDAVHRTEVVLHNVVIKGIKADQVHLAYSEIASISPGSNLDALHLNREEMKAKGVAYIVQGSGDAKPGYATCKDAFVPMR